MILNQVISMPSFYRLFMGDLNCNLIKLSYPEAKAINDIAMNSN